jgi:outer membrane lipoprotein carrier protein
MARAFRVALLRGGVVALGLAWLPASASGLDQLRAFLEGTHSGRTAFTQTVTSRAGRPAKEASGTFSFQRPGKFRWTYDKPFRQVIVGDGTRLWIYDPDLNQVLVRTLGEALGASPAALLAGDNALERNFTLTGGIASDGLEWVEARPKAPDSAFQEVRIGFQDNLPQRMELRDSFGQLTRLSFSGFERNIRPDPETFRFTPPSGADVVGQ